RSKGLIDALPEGPPAATGFPRMVLPGRFAAQSHVDFVGAVPIQSDGPDASPRAVPPRRLGLRGEGRRLAHARVPVRTKAGIYTATARPIWAEAAASLDSLIP